MARQLDAVKVEIAVILGRSKLPMHQLLRMGRGAVIPLDTKDTDEVWILANDHPIAKGDIQIEGERMSVVVTRPANAQDFNVID
ncbi:FliM/FliN family flagellar motor switch protein [Ponticaulis profundi]|uniref:FliM/FliN family flagellar motor switch protein n=1 Tax=Ponticaulis profundi TaxID=2665222 RepID=A0ABW1S4L8_9PROT